MTRHDKSADRHQGSKPAGVGLDEFTVFAPERVKRRGSATRHILFLGVAGACVMGVGLGLWARPAMTERRAAAPAPAPADVAKAAPVEHRLQILVGDHPAPARAPPEAPAKADPLPMEAPRVVAEAAPPPPATPIPRPVAMKAAFAPLPVAAASPPRAIAPKARPVAPPAPVHLAKAAPDPKVVARAHRLELAQAAAAKAAAHRLELAQAQQAKATQAQQAKAAVKAVRQHQVELAKAEAKGRSEARAEAKAIALAEARDDARKKARLLALAHAVQKLMPHQARPAPAPVQLAKAERRHAAKAHREPTIERASLKTRKAPPRAAPPAYRVRAPQPPPPPQHASGLMRVSDPGLGAAERQLNRAYQDARAAGVPDAQLQRQQQHWLAARQAAAREAPWAVHDVYLARIAELNGQAREARPDGY